MGARRLVLALSAAALAAIPLGLQGYPLYLATEAAIFGIAAVGLDLLVGRLGLVSLGHAAFFGVGAYAAALMALEVPGFPGSTLLVAALATGGLGAAMAPLVLRSHGVFFLMLTLAIAQMLFAGAEQWVDVTGGNDGLSGVPKLGAAWGLDSPTAFYLCTLVLLGGILWAVRRLSMAPFGRVMEAVHEAEGKARALGYPAFWYKLGALVLSGALAGLAGALYAHHTGYVSPHQLHWGTSGVLLGMVLLGGRGTTWGPVIGAAVFTFAQAWISSWTDLWQLFLGFLFIAAVRSGPKALWGLLEEGMERGFRPARTTN